jgi:hypothetical protein
MAAPGKGSYSYSRFLVVLYQSHLIEQIGKVRRKPQVKVIAARQGLTAT